MHLHFHFSDRLYQLYFRELAVSIIVRAEIVAVERKVMRLQAALTVNKIGLLDRLKYVSKSRGDIKRQVIRSFHIL